MVIIPHRSRLFQALLSQPLSGPVFRIDLKRDIEFNARQVILNSRYLAGIKSRYTACCYVCSTHRATPRVKNSPSKLIIIKSLFQILGYNTDMNENLPAILKSSALATLEDHARTLVIREMQTLSLKRGAAVFHVGDSASNYLMIKSGAVRVSVITEQGREIVLYRVEPGETCVLTTSSLLSGAEYDAEAVAEEDTEAVILPKAAFDSLMATSARFRQFVFSSFGERLHTLIALVQEITVKHVDRRLARHLISHQKGGIVTATHQSLALELNTAREVITRLLGDFAHRDWVAVSRGRVVIKNEPALELLAATL